MRIRVVPIPMPPIPPILHRHLIHLIRLIRSSICFGTDAIFVWHLFPASVSGTCFRASSRVRTQIKHAMLKRLRLFNI